MREMLGATQRKEAMDKARVAALHAEIDLIMARPAAAAAAARRPLHRLPQLPGRRADARRPRSGWRIHFVPGPKLLRHGNDPLRILRELATLGPCEVSRRRQVAFPPLADLDPEVCRLRWNIEVQGEIERAAIQAVFEWVEGECELNIERIGGEPSAAAAAPARSRLRRPRSPQHRAGRSGRAAEGRSAPPAAPTPMAARFASASRRSTSC